MFEDKRGSGLKITAIGGGTGLSTMLRGLKLCTENITAVVTTADDGGSSGMLRQDMDIIPPGDIRNCILALANTEPTMEKVLSYRFTEGALAGHSFGNLFLAALTGVSGSFDTAIERMSEVLAVTGKVLPVSAEPTKLEALLENGMRIFGESNIFQAKKEQKCRVREVRILPDKPRAHSEVLEAIASADLVVLGPGSLYTSVMPNLLVDGISAALMTTSALRVYVCNLMTQEGETEEYTAYDHIREIYNHAGGSVIDICLANSAPIPARFLESYAAENACATRIDRELFAMNSLELRERPLIDTHGQNIRHNPLLLALALYELFCEKRTRAGLYGGMDDMTLRWLREKIREE